MKDLINGFFECCWATLYVATENTFQDESCQNNELCIFSRNAPCFFVGENYIDFAIGKVERGCYSYIGRERYMETDNVLSELVKIKFQQELENYLESVGYEAEENRLFKPTETTHSQLSKMLGGSK